jgi:hypothetical protein
VDKKRRRGERRGESERGEGREMRDVSDVSEREICGERDERERREGGG